MVYKIIQSCLMQYNQHGEGMLSCVCVVTVCKMINNCVILLRPLDF